MRLSVLYDDSGNVLATQEVLSDPDETEPQSAIAPLDGQYLAEFEVPSHYTDKTPLERHEGLRVNTAADQHHLVEKNS